MLPGPRRRRQGEAGLDADGARKTGLATMLTTRSSLVVEIVVTALFLTVFALAPGALAQTGGTLVIGLDQEPPTLDPHASPSAVTFQIIASVTESLLYRGPDGKLVPWLAESWSTSGDGRSVKFNFDRIVDPKFKAGGARAALAGYAGSKVLDEYAVQVSFETPYSPFLNAAASGVLSIVSPK